jgi:hypothetical protein
MDYTNEKELYVMTCDRGSKKVNFNVKKPIALEAGDSVRIKRGEFDKTIVIDKIIESRQSSMKDFNYVTTEITEKF